MRTWIAGASLVCLMGMPAFADTELELVNGRAVRSDVGSETDVFLVDLRTGLDGRAGGFRLEIRLAAPFDGEDDPPSGGVRMRLVNPRVAEGGPAPGGVYGLDGSVEAESGTDTAVIGGGPVSFVEERSAGSFVATDDGLYRIEVTGLNESARTEYTVQARWHAPNVLIGVGVGVRSRALGQSGNLIVCEPIESFTVPYVAPADANLVITARDGRKYQGYAPRDCASFRDDLARPFSGSQFDELSDDALMDLLASGTTEPSERPPFRRRASFTEPTLAQIIGEGAPRDRFVTDISQRARRTGSGRGQRLSRFRQPETGSAEVAIRPLSGRPGFIEGRIRITSPRPRLRELDLTSELPPGQGTSTIDESGYDFGRVIGVRGGMFEAGELQEQGPTAVPSDVFFQVSVPEKAFRRSEVVLVQRAQIDAQAPNLVPVGAGVRVGPGRQRLRKPVTVTISYNSGTATNRLLLIQQDPNGRQSQIVGAFNSDDRTVTFNTRRLGSSFQVFELD